MRQRQSSLSDSHQAESTTITIVTTTRTTTRISIDNHNKENITLLLVLKAKSEKVVEWKIANEEKEQQQGAREEERIRDATDNLLAAQTKRATVWTLPCDSHREPICFTAVFEVTEIFTQQQEARQRPSC